MRNTKSTQAILSKLNQGKALSHRELQDGLGGLCDRVTIYRVLGRLEQEGLVHKVADVDGTVRYAVCSACNSDHAHSHEHLHFTCVKCSATTCLEEVNVSFVLPKGYELSESNFAVSGICASCSNG